MNNACKDNGDGYMDGSKLDGVSDVVKNDKGEATEFIYHNAHVFKIKCSKIGPVVAIYDDLAALIFCIRYCKGNRVFHPITYVLACRIGSFIGRYAKKIQMLGGKLYLNPDGDAQ